MLPVISHFPLKIDKPSQRVRYRLDERDTATFEQAITAAVDGRA